MALTASLAIAAAGLAGPASAQYIDYDPWCVQYFKNYCAGRWQVENFATFSACWEYYIEASCPPNEYYFGAAFGPPASGRNG